MSKTSPPVDSPDDRLEAVREKRDALETLATSDLPVATRAQDLLDAADEEGPT